MRMPGCSTAKMGGAGSMANGSPRRCRRRLAKAAEAEMVGWLGEKAVGLRDGRKGEEEAGVMIRGR